MEGERRDKEKSKAIEIEKLTCKLEGTNKMLTILKEIKSVESKAKELLRERAR